METASVSEQKVCDKMIEDLVERRPIARDSDKFKRLYKMRAKVERLNGRLDRDYMLNDHFIRGKRKWM